MKTQFNLALSMLAGAALGGAAIEALHAQAKPPVYMIAINEVSDQEGYAKEYIPPAQKSVRDRGGEYVAAGPGTQLAGNLPHGPVVILRWESMEALQGWRNSPEFQAAPNVGEKYAKFNIVAVNGLKCARVSNASRSAASVFHFVPTVPRHPARLPIPA